MGVKCGIFYRTICDICSLGTSSLTMDMPHQPTTPQQRLLHAGQCHHIRKRHQTSKTTSVVHFFHNTTDAAQDSIPGFGAAAGLPLLAFSCFGGASAVAAPLSTFTAADNPSACPPPFASALASCLGAVAGPATPAAADGLAAPSAPTPPRFEI